MITSSIIEILGIALGGGVIGQILTAFLSKKQQDSLDFNQIIKTWQEDNNRLREREDENKRRIVELEILTHELQTKLMLLESATQDLPFPMWLKDLDGKMLSLNPAFESLFLIPQGFTKKDYVGKYDKDIWPEEVAEQYMKGDIQVMIENQPIRTEEDVPVAGVIKKYVVIKFPRYVGRTLVGIAGIAIEKDFNKTNK